MSNLDTAPWWQRAVIYQIYPRSFQDSNGDGIGDLAGITRRLSYLAQTLGVQAIWLSPFYPSPMADFGYDVADYCDVAPCFGDLAAFDDLVAACRQRGLKLIIDFVPNHSSDQHPWFIASRADRSAERRDWYVWADPAPGGAPPNNWLSVFGGPAWTLDGPRGSTTCTPFCPSNLTSTGATRSCAEPCCRRCASGSTGGSTASASTWLTT